MKNRSFILITLFLINTFSYTEKILIFGGKTGWIGQKLVRLFNNAGYEAIAATSRLEEREHIRQEINNIKPDYIINAAGITGRPNVDWCEDHKAESMRANLWGPINLADISKEYGIHLTNISTGCIYTYDKTHPLGSGIGFTEEDIPNFTGSFYSQCKVDLEKYICTYDNVLHLRLRMPIDDTLTERAFIGKIVKYKKLVNIPNSMAIVYDILPAIVTLCLRKKTGIYNLVNPGTISHHEIMHLYQKYIDPTHTFETFSEEEQNKILKVPRSNCELNANKLLSECPEIPHIQDSIINVFKRMQKNSST